MSITSFLGGTISGHNLTFPQGEGMVPLTMSWGITFMTCGDWKCGDSSVLQIKVGRDGWNSEKKSTDGYFQQPWHCSQIPGTNANEAFLYLLQWTDKTPPQTHQPTSLPESDLPHSQTSLVYLLFINNHEGKLQPRSLWTVKSQIHNLRCEHLRFGAPSTPPPSSGKSTPDFWCPIQQ